MKGPNIFMAAGTFVLAITGVLATRVNKRLTAISSASFYFPIPYTLAYATICLPSSHFTTDTIAGPQVYIGLYTSATGSPAVFVGEPLLARGNPVYNH